MNVIMHLSARLDICIFINESKTGEKNGILMFCNKHYIIKPKPDVNSSITIYFVLLLLPEWDEIITVKNIII